MLASAALKFEARVHFKGVWVGDSPIVVPTVIHAIADITSHAQLVDLLAYPDATRLARRMFREAGESPAGFGVELRVGFETPEEVEFIREKCRPIDAKTLAACA